MRSVQEFANFFIDYFYRKGIENDLTNMKLNKLLYFIYGMYLSKTGKKIFDAEFRAYKYGPVETSVYDAYKSFGSNLILHSKFPDVGVFSCYDLESDQLEVLTDVLNRYGDRSAWSLSELTHIDYDSPWSKVDYNKKEKINDDDMIEYFKSDFPESISDIVKNAEPYGHCDENLDLTFPNDDEDRDDCWD